MDQLSRILRCAKRKIVGTELCLFDNPIKRHKALCESLSSVHSQTHVDRTVSQNMQGESAAPEIWRSIPSSSGGGAARDRYPSASRTLLSDWQGIAIEVVTRDRELAEEFHRGRNIRDQI